MIDFLEATEAAIGLSMYRSIYRLYRCATPSLRAFSPSSPPGEPSPCPSRDYVPKKETWREPSFKRVPNVSNIHSNGTVDRSFPENDRRRRETDSMIGRFLIPSMKFFSIQSAFGNIFRRKRSSKIRSMVDWIGFLFLFGRNFDYQFDERLIEADSLACYDTQ